MNKDSLDVKENVNFIVIEKILKLFVSANSEVDYSNEKSTRCFTKN